MSVVSSFAKIRPRRGTLTAWSLENPILEEGEMALEVPDTGIGTGISKMKIGDGIHRYTELPYSLDGTSAIEIIGGGVIEEYSHLIQLRSGTAEEWALEDPIIRRDEVVYDRTANSIKIGNGTSRFSELPYVNAGGILNDINGGSEG